MNKKYFLRGFGTGVIFSVFILGIACAYRTSEGEIMRQARELGMVWEDEAEEKKDMVFATTTPAIQTTPVAEEKEKNTPKPEATPENTNPPEETKEPENTVKPEVTAEPEETRKPGGNSQGQKNSENVDFQIVRGMWSDAVAEALVEKGLVDNAKAFDKYLNNHGYASSIKVGNFQIPRGATYEEIAQILTGD